MNAQARKRMVEPEQSPGMSRAILFSLIFHVTVITVGTLGLPFIRKDRDLIATPVPIEMMDISDITQTTKPAEREMLKPAEEKPEPPKPEPERPKQAPKQASEAPPRPVAPPKEELTVPDKTKVPEKKVEEKPKPKPPEPKKRPVVKEDAKTPPTEDPFQSLLKNLQEAKPEAAEGEGTKPVTPAAQPIPLGEQMSMTELDALRQQLAQCWNVLAGARYAEDLVVDIKLYMNQDGTVRQAGVVDQLRYNTDTIFRAAADSALRAVRDPSCSPFRLPPEKYNQWKNMTVTFDPREIL